LCKLDFAGWAGNINLNFVYPRPGNIVVKAQFVGKQKLTLVKGKQKPIVQIPFDKYYQPGDDTRCYLSIHSSVSMQFKLTPLLDSTSKRKI
jgi:hypothetical protein